MRSAALLIVGDEILSGEIADENGPHTIRLLNEAGVRVERLVTAPDAVDAVVGELTRLRGLADGIIVSGGIGPTHDDVTRPAIARALGCDLVVQPEAERRIRAFYGERVTEAELSMAEMPRGAALLDGERTGTFGFALAGVFVLPGVPFLFRDIVGGVVASFRRAPLLRGEIRTRRREGEIARPLADVQGRLLDVAIGSYPVYEEGAWYVRVVVRAGDPARLQEGLDALRTHLEA
jgi:molybdenum cofactor synthesis domain-containing protein